MEPADILSDRLSETNEIVGDNMAVPDFQTLMLPLLKLASDGQQHNQSEAVEWLAQEFQLSDEDRAQVLRSGQTRLYNRVGWTTTYLKKAGLLQAVAPGRFQILDRGREVLASQPSAIDIAYLEKRFPEFSEFRKSRSRREVVDEEPPAIFDAARRTWSQRAEVSERIRENRTRPVEAALRCAVTREMVCPLICESMRAHDDGNG